MTKLGFFLTVCLLAAVAAGCVELDRQRTALKPRVIGDAALVRKPGVSVSMPDPSGLSGGIPGDSDGLYRVGKTDTLTGIARRFYGDAAYSRYIKERNADLLREAGGLKRGLVIELPRMMKPEDMSSG